VPEETQRQRFLRTSDVKDRSRPRRDPGVEPRTGGPPTKGTVGAIYDLVTYPLHATAQRLGLWYLITCREPDRGGGTANWSQKWTWIYGR
jgi:hypothetical protein